MDLRLLLCSVIADVAREPVSPTLEQLELLISHLTETQQKIIRHRYGIVDGQFHALGVIAAIIGLPLDETKLAYLNSIQSLGHKYQDLAQGKPITRDEELVLTPFEKQLGRVLRAREGVGTPDCVNDDVMLSLLEQGGNYPNATELLLHISECGYCSTNYGKIREFLIMRAHHIAKKQLNLDDLVTD